MLLLRPRERFAEGAGGAASLLQRGRAGAGQALPPRPAAPSSAPRPRWTSACWPLRRPRAAAGGRPCAAGAAAAAALTLGTALAALPLRAVARQRAKDVGLVTQSWGGWAVDMAKAAAIGGAFSRGRRRRADRRHAPLRPRAGGRPARPWARGVAVVFTYLGPVVLDPLFNRFTAAARGRPARPRCSTWRAAPASRWARSTRSTPPAARRRPTPTSPGWARPSASCSTTRCCGTSRPAETRLVVAHELGHVRHRDVAHGLLWLALVAPFGDAGAWPARRSG